MTRVYEATNIKNIWTKLLELSAYHASLVQFFGESECSRAKTYYQKGCNQDLISKEHLRYADNLDSK